MRQVPGYPKYRVDQYGVVYGLRKQLKQLTNRFGVKHVPLYREERGRRKGKCHEVHLIVAAAYLPGNGPVHHLNGDVGDNRLANLSRGPKPKPKLAKMFYLSPVDDTFDCAWRESCVERFRFLKVMSG